MGESIQRGCGSCRWRRAGAGRDVRLRLECRRRRHRGYSDVRRGALQPGARVKAARVVMPMAVSPDRRFLYAASRSKPYSVHVYAIDRSSGALTPCDVADSGELSVHFARQDRALLFGASYGGELDQRQAVEGRRTCRGRAAAGDPGWPKRPLDPRRREQQVRFRSHAGQRRDIPVHLRREEGRLASNTPAVYLMKPVTGPAPFCYLERQQVRIPAQ